MKQGRMGAVHVYTGNGKGKTTAAIGLSVRAVGAGLRVAFVQFLKGQVCAEHEALKRFAGELDLFQFGRPEFVVGAPKDEDRAAVQRGLEQAEKVLSSGEYDVVVLDEVFSARQVGLLDTATILDLLDKRWPNVEVVLTGRQAPDAVIERADLVSEIREIRHYYRDGIPARTGIEF